MNEHDQLDPRCAEFYRDSMRLLQRAKVPFMVGGAFALAKHAGIERFTKDFDVFILPDDSERAVRAFADAGYETEMTPRTGSRKRSGTTSSST